MMDENPVGTGESVLKHLSRELFSLKRAISDFLRDNKAELIAGIDRIVESAAGKYSSLPVERVEDIRKSNRDFLELYMYYFDAPEPPMKAVRDVALEAGGRGAAQGVRLNAVIGTFDQCETYVWDRMVREFLDMDFTAEAWIEIARMRDRFTKEVRHYIRRAYVKEEKSAVERQLKELRALAGLGQVIVSTVDLERVLGQIVEAAAGLMQVRMGAVLLLDDSKRNLEVVAETGLARSWAGGRESVPLEKSLMSVVLRRGEYVLARDDELKGFKLPRAGAGRKTRSALAVPITVDDETIGVMELYDTAPREYSDLDLTMLATFCSTAGVAVKNARLFQEERRLQRQATLLMDVAQKITEMRDLDELLEMIAEKTAVAMGVDRCSIFFYEPEANALTFVAGFGRSTLQVWLLNQFHIPVSELGVATERAIRTREPVLATDAGEELSLESRLFRGPGVRSYMQVPLVVKDELIGLMSLEFLSSEVRFSADDVALANSLARQAAVAIQNRRLQEKLFEQQLTIKNAEINERLYRERERSEAVLKATPDAVLVIDRDHKVTLTNPAAEYMTGWSLQEAKGRGCHEILYGSPSSPGFCPGPDCPIDRMLSGEQVAYSEDEIVSRTGEHIPVAGTFASIMGPDGKIENVVAVYRDARQQKELEKYALMQREMDIASGIQTSLLPREGLEARGVRIQARQQQAHLVGGDWYDYWLYGDKIFLMIGDASGNGVGAALFATMALSALRVESREHGDLSQVLEHVNRSLYIGNRSDSFVTVFLGVLDLTTMTLIYTNAGHEEPLCVGKAGKAPETLSSDKRSLLGIFASADLDVKTRRLYPGERMVLYTDGVIDARSSKDKLYGLKRLNRFVAANRDLPIGEFIDTLIENVLEFCKGEPPDDMTVMVCDIP
jgi:PAS domain S-box-containing protein